jgi:cytoskeleton protein RodZ
MEPVPENNVGKDNSAAALAPIPLGKMLRDARERLNLSVAEVASQIKFAPRQIEALEADDLQHFPEAAFLRGFVRSYAKILSLDAQTLLAALPQVKTALAESVPISVEVPFPGGHSPQKQNVILLGAALLLAMVVVGFAVWHFTTPIKSPEVVNEIGKNEVAKNDASKIEIPISLPAQMPSAPTAAVPEPSMPVPSPIVSKPRPPAKVQASAPPVVKSVVTSQKAATPIAATPIAITPVTSAPATIAPADPSTPVVRMRLVFDEEAWAEVTDQQGIVISSKINPQGSELKLQRHAPLSLVIGHAKTTHLYRDDKPVDLTRYTNSSSEVARITLK